MPTALEKIHTIALERFKKAEEYDKDQRILAVEDTKFAHAEDGQWDDDAKEKRGDRPRYTFNRVIGVIKQITGDHRQNRSQIKIAPDSGGATDETAEVLSGLVRKIKKTSNAQEAYDNAFDEKVAGGYGGWRIVTEWKDDSMDQQILIKPIISACTSHYIDPSSKCIDGSDSNYQFLITEMDEDEYKLKYLNASVTDFSNSQYQSGNCQGWFANNHVRVAEYWVKTPVTKTIALLSDGRIIDLKEEEGVIDELALKGITVVKTRKAKSHKVEMYKMNGAEILEGPIEWAGKYIPLVPDIGERITVENKRYTRGIVRFAKDSNRTYNYARSTDIETYALTPKDPYWITDTMALGHKEQLENFPKKNQPFMLYNPDPKHPGPPSRSGAPSLPAAGIEISKQSIDDTHATTSMYPPAMGNAPQLLSEKSVKSQAEKGDIGAYVYQDHHEKALQYTGQILVDLIPRIIDTPQQIEILGIDGKADTVEVNTPKFDSLNQTVIDEQTKKPVIVNDLKLGKYNVSIETGPAFSTQREESADQLIRLSDASPIFEQFTPDLIAENLNLVGSDRFIKRLRKWAIQNGLEEPTEEEIKEFKLDNQQSNPQEEALVKNVEEQTKNLEKDTQLKDAKTQETLVKTQSEAVSAYNDLLTVLQKQLDMGIPLSEQQRNLVIAQGDLVADGQDMLRDDQPNSEQAEDLARMVVSGEIPPLQ